ATPDDSVRHSGARIPYSWGGGLSSPPPWRGWRGSSGGANARFPRQGTRAQPSRVFSQLWWSQGRSQVEQGEVAGGPVDVGLGRFLTTLGPGGAEQAVPHRPQGGHDPGPHLGVVPEV